MWEGENSNPKDEKYTGRKQNRKIEDGSHIDRNDELTLKYLYMVIFVYRFCLELSTVPCLGERLNCWKLRETFTEDTVALGELLDVRSDAYKVCVRVGGAWMLGAMCRFSIIRVCGVWEGEVIVLCYSGARGSCVT